MLVTLLSQHPRAVANHFDAYECFYQKQGCYVRPLEFFEKKKVCSKDEVD